MGTAIGRTVAFALGVFTLLNLISGDNVWWIDVRPLPEPILALPGLVLLHHAIRPGRFRRLVAITVLLLIGAVGWNAVRFHAGGAYEPGVPLPFSVLVIASLLLVLKAPRTKRPRLAAAVTLLALGVGFPVAQVFFFGKTSYARPADAIVVFGARCYADGRPSLTLADRVRTGCRLYREGYAPRLVLSGGPGDGATHETGAMRALARREGVPDEAIVVDRDGVNTQATVDNSPPGRLLAVSHFYHLPRIKLAYRRAGRQAFTVPAEQTRRVPQTPRLVAREVAAFWVYYLRF